VVAIANTSRPLNVLFMYDSEFRCAAMEHHVRQRSRKKVFEQEAFAIRTSSMPGRVLPPLSQRGR
jgi:hypothetical protein